MITRTRGSERTQGSHLGRWAPRQRPPAFSLALSDCLLAEALAGNPEPAVCEEASLEPCARVAEVKQVTAISCHPQVTVDSTTPRPKAAAMTSRISHTSFDASNAYAQSVFWSHVLDFVQDPDDPNEPGHEECLIMSRDQSQLLLFITVPDDKQVKNRVHLDLRPVDRTRDQEAQRLLELGASQLADHRRPDGSGWITMADPEGNEFCILSQQPPRPGTST